MTSQAVTAYHKSLQKNISLMYIYNALTAGLFHIPIWIIFLQDFLTFGQMAFFNALFFILIFLFELPTGAFADLFGRKYSLILGSIFNAIGFILLGLTPSFPTMIMFVVINGIGVSLQSGANQSLTFDTLKELNRSEEYPRVSARTSLYFQLIGAFAILTGGYLFSSYHGLPYILRGALYVFSIIPALILIEPRIDSEKFSWNAYLTQTTHGIKEAFKTSYLAKLSLMYVVVSGIAMSNQRFFIQAFMLEGGLNDIHRSWLASGVKIFIAFLIVFLASRKKLFSSRYFLLFLPTLMIISLLIAPFVSWPLLLAVLIGIAIPSGSRSIFLGYPVQLQLNSKYRATALSVLSMFASLVYAANNIIGSQVVQRYSVAWYYFGLGLFMLISIIPLVINLIRTEK